MSLFLDFIDEGSAPGVTTVYASQKLLHLNELLEAVAELRYTPRLEQ